MQIQTERQGTVGIIRLAGELDLDAHPALTEATRSLLDPDPVQRIDIDASKLTFVDSAGLVALLTLRTTAKRHGIETRLLAASPHLSRVLDLTGLDDLFPFDHP